VARCYMHWNALPIGPKCCLERGHEGPHLYKCCDPNCPGYPYPASVRAHPCPDGGDKDATKKNRRAG